MKVSRREIGARLRDAREAKGLTQRQVSDLMGYSSPQFISNIERGLCGPALKSARKYCDYIGLSPEVLAEGLLALYQKDIQKAMKLKLPHRG